jgi:hypothetical protein
MKKVAEPQTLGGHARRLDRDPPELQRPEVAGPTCARAPQSPMWARPGAAVLPGPSGVEIWAGALAVLMFIQIASADAQVLGRPGVALSLSRRASDPFAAARSEVEPGSRGQGPG